MTTNSFKPPNLFSDIAQNMHDDSESRQGDSDTHTAKRDKELPKAAQDTRDENSSGKGTGLATTDGNNMRNRIDGVQQNDLAVSIPGLYRVLDLIHEQGSGGLVDKIIIEQDSLGRLMNALRPHAYTSITKVDFSTLDEVEIRPIGIYGSKSAIVEFLRKKNLVDPQIAEAMLQPTEHSSTHEPPSLRSGMYVLTHEAEHIMYVVYWPEDTTWDDSAASSVRRSRITFMRYLTKITDQVICFLSDEHVNAIVWRDDLDTAGEDTDDDDDGDRLFAFEVSKTNEQEEGVTSRPGFTVSNSLIVAQDPPANCEVDRATLRPRLCTGEVQQGVMTAAFLPAQKRDHKAIQFFTEYRLKSWLKQENVRLSETLSLPAVDALLDAGLNHNANAAVADYRKAARDLRDNSNKYRNEHLDKMTAEIDSQSASLRGNIESLLTKMVHDKFPSLQPMQPASSNDGEVCETPPDNEHLNNLARLYPNIMGLVQDTLKKASKLRSINHLKYKILKERILALDHLLVETPQLVDEQRVELVSNVLDNGFEKGSSGPGGSWTIQMKGALNKYLGFSIFGENAPRVPKAVLEVDDDAFLSESYLSAIADRSPALAESVSKAVEHAQQHFRDVIQRETRSLLPNIQNIQRNGCRSQIDSKVEAEKTQRLEELRVQLLKELMSSMSSVSASKTSTILHVDIDKAHWSGAPPSFKITILEERHTEPTICYSVYPLELKQDDRHRMQEDSTHVPNPQIRAPSSFTFTLSLDTDVLYCHLLPNSRCLLIVQDRFGDCKIYVSTTVNLHEVVARRPTKELKRDKIGDNFLLSYDESKRVLAVCSISLGQRESHLQLNTFVFDETYTSLQGMGSAVNLSPWYDSSVSIKHMQSVSGSEEILFVDDFARARVFSLVTQQFRPATLQLPMVPSAVYPTPDGACFFAINVSDDLKHVSLRAYHWSSFGSSDGIEVELPQSFMCSNDNTITSLMSRNNVYLLGLHPEERTMYSLAFNITRRVTEFTFKERGGSSYQDGKNQMTSHNSIIDCHADVWTRFPVVPAVRRETIVSSHLRQPRCLVFVSSRSNSPFVNHFATLIDDFERTTRKPVGDELSSIVVLATNQETFLENFPFVPSTFRSGEWLVELICLIPIHIAVTRDNRFVPLKDGVWSAELERSLLGADVAKIVDSISFGWYESFFQSYMAKKPVKVVSSMGEQSVGKSFALNHLVDTSFAGSAMRTTEGVWMSVTPTREALIVALDFEGVHSIERSAQEDTLLVLFNTAVSNLVLFRNNFALSRDITGLFQSFQSSASVLDPEANPMLFQSTLVIIIKDVVDSDKNEIKKEFHLKFQQIVQAEQAMNFITRLHRNRLDIVPWPVIESKQFYTLFKTVKKRLDQQAVTHSGGAIFLQTIKTLMAKLKANDWGSMSQNLATHRAHLLLSLLTNALVFGASEIIPDREPLTDLDSATVIDMPDTGSYFYIPDNGPQGQPASQDDAIHELCLACPSYCTRFDITENKWSGQIQAYLDKLIDLRIAHVQAWLSANTANFPATHADIQGLYRTFDSLAIDLKATFQLCGAQCSSCKLNCILGRHHDGEHNCQTDHHCPHTCQFTEGVEHDEHEPCSLQAGHPGPHLCDVSAHLCGKPCKLSDKRGCQEACVKMIDHNDEEHLCAAQVHECGMPCSLSGVQLRNGQVFSCQQPCGIASHILHSEHHCESRQCPIGCQLCKRLCSEHDHLHGLDPDAVHLCGQEHACSALCSAKGICQIDTSPQSVEATFTGRHESFQYTKYTQVAKRLPCVITIPVGETEHHGNHSHDASQKCFHHCETRCPDCGYFCMLPLGHTQQEHDTSHGSMSKTKWTVDGPDGTVLEVNGRKFGSNDDGAPMLCSMYCRSMGRHAHIDWCRSDDLAACSGNEYEHIKIPMQPHPVKPKDWITHSLYWKRTGFKDPYSQEDQTNFAKCDRMCSGPEHDANTHAGAQLSYCTLPILHPRQRLDQAPPGGLGYISNDGHAFSCRNPVVMRQAFHVIFAIDRSGSMSYNDRRPLDNTPTSQLIRRSHNNRLGAVFSSLHAFWEARHHAIAAAGGNAGGAVRRDAYTVILFHHNVTTAINHDFQSDPIRLLNTVLGNQADGGTNFTVAIETARTAMENHWSNERSPVVIFLSDGECSIADETMQDLCRRSIARGKPLSFHAVAFGPSTGTLRRMAQIARDVESNVPPDPLNPHAGIPSSYAEALDTVRLAETFLGIAESLAKPRGALFRG
ncbi:hypothetical protein C8Q74DRAFT_810377 [Fomes fomentarius]|nr:hypothetical protein C8Q74DRAFT_810377 [Fomes fomentarius]